MPNETARKVLEIEAEAISALVGRLDDAFDMALTLLDQCKGRVVTTGMGKSGIICRKLAATLASTGTPALFLHPGEAIHGDLGMITEGDVVLMLSNSGETSELLTLLETIKRLGVPLISLIGNPTSTVAVNADVVLDVSVDEEACPFGLAPTASTTAALALGDALAMALSEKRGFGFEDFARLHPGGGLGKKLAKVRDLMHTDSQLPIVRADTPMNEVIYEMSRKGLGVATVVDSRNRLVGLISDGDLRRLLQTEREAVFSLSADQCMTRDPVTIGAEELAVTGLKLMEEKKITSLVVTDEANEVEGLLHLHDLWGTELF
jgi:arabinose-5-phosphate isomerase